MSLFCLPSLFLSLFLKSSSVSVSLFSSLLLYYPLPRGLHRYLEEAHDLQQHRTAFAADRAAFEPPAGLRVGVLGDGFGAAHDTGLGHGGGSAAEFGSSLSSTQSGGLNFGGFGLGLSSTGGAGGIAPSSLGGIAGPYPYRAGGSLIGGGASSNRL